MHSASLQLYYNTAFVNISMLAHFTLEARQVHQPHGDTHQTGSLPTFFHCAVEVRKVDRLTAFPEASWLISDVTGIIIHPITLRWFVQSHHKGEVEHYTIRLSYDRNLKKTEAMIWTSALISPIAPLGEIRSYHQLILHEFTESLDTNTDTHGCLMFPAIKFTILISI